MKAFRQGDLVQWAWGDGHAWGKVKKKYTDDVSLTIQGSSVSREADQDSPAYLIEQLDGDADRVLKSHSEVKSVTKDVLYNYAQEIELDGRSDMSKEELVEALT